MSRHEVMIVTKMKAEIGCTGKHAKPVLLRLQLELLRLFRSRLFAFVLTTPRVSIHIKDSLIGRLVTLQNLRPLLCSPCVLDLASALAVSYKFQACHG